MSGGAGVNSMPTECERRSRGRPRKLDRVAAAEAVLRYAAGETWKEIARAFGVEQDTVIRHAREFCGSVVLELKSRARAGSPA